MSSETFRVREMVKEGDWVGQVMNWGNLQEEQSREVVQYICWQVPLRILFMTKHLRNMRNCILEQTGLLATLLLNSDTGLG